MRRASPARSFPRMAFGGIVSLALLLLLGLSSCAYTTTNDPLAVAQVNGASIPLASYQTLLPFSIARLEYNQSNPNSNSAPLPIDWRLASQRSDYAQAQRNTLDLLIDLELIKEQLQAQHISVPAKALNAAKAQIVAERIAFEQQLTQDPTNSALSALVASLTPGAIDIFAQQTADIEALANHARVPQAHVYEIVVAKRQQAQHVLTLAQHGANFSLLARQYSTAGSASSDLGVIYAGQLTYSAYLAAQNNEPSQFASGVGAAFDKAVFVPQRPPAFVMLPLASGVGYGVFAITQYSAKTMSIADQTIRISYIENWIADTLHPRADIHQYIVIG